MLRLYGKSLGNPTHKFIYMLMIAQQIVVVKKIDKSFASVTHNKSTCIYKADARINDTGKLFANRNGHYKALSVAAQNSVTLKITI